MSSIITVGSVALDSINTASNKAHSIIGGSATYFSIAASLFTKVKLVGIVGDDFPDEGLAIFKKNNINIENLQKVSGTTFSWSCRYNADFSHRETLSTELGVFANFNPTKIIGEDKNDYLFLANIHPNLQNQVLELSGEKKLFACDTMNLWINNNLNELYNVLLNIDLFFLNEEEAFMIANSDVLSDCFECITQLGPKTIVIKLGERGCAIYEKGVVTKKSAFPVSNVIDPTGAGDCFAGGVLGYMLNTGSSLLDAIDFGSAVASFAIEDFGINKLLSINMNDIKGRVNLLRRQ